ncbi:MAG: SufE family protein [Cytophagaceae bacterium]|nr:SufE family protein [Cytophagaceae bacterium]MDW8457055.1 SufE family protein [Cytophagaceae bacterium]
MHRSIDEIQNSIIKDFSLMDEWDDKYAYIIELGKSLPPFPEDQRKDENLIKGCQSKVWLTSSFENGLVYFMADSDALIVKGLVSLLIKVYSNQHPEDIINTEPYFIDAIGMRQHLSMTRSNGLTSMVKQMKLHALAYKNKS